MLPQSTRPQKGEQEEWRPVVGWEDIYEVSDFGQVRRICAGWAVRKGKVLRWRKNSQGYWSVWLCRDGKKFGRFVHRLVAEAFLGPCPEGWQVNHKDYNPGNPRVDNLEYVTPSENVRHAYQHGRFCALRGERHWAAKLNWPAVQAIRASDEPTRRLAEHYGVSMSLIQQIRAGKIWQQPPPDE